MAVIEYARVSPHEQNLDLRIDSLKRAGCDEIYTEQASGTNIIGSRFTFSHRENQCFGMILISEMLARGTIHGKEWRYDA